MATYDMTCLDNRADYSDILIAVNNKVFVVWHDDVTGKYEIYSSVFDMNLNIINSCTTVSEGNGGARYPVLSERQLTGDIYIVWEDYTKEYIEFGPLDPYDDAYVEASVIQREPNQYTIFIAYYDNLEGVFYSSGKNSFDVKLIFNDQRSARFPAIGKSFSGELYVLYECYFVDEYSFLNNKDLFSQIRCALYNLVVVIL